MSGRRPRTSIETTRKSSTFPNISRRKRITTTQADVRDLKLKIQKMNANKIQMKSKTTRMKQILQDRNNAIDQVFKESNENKKLQTASDSTLNQLRINIKGLENTLATRQEDLRDILFSDRFAVSDELQQEVKIYYLEHKRLLTQSKAVKEGEKIVGDELDRVRNEMSERFLNIKAIESLQKSVKDIVSKVVAYKKSEIKLQNDALATYLVRNPKHAESKEKQLNIEINQIYEDIENIEKETKEAEDREQEMINSLQQIIDVEAAKINEQLERIKQQEREEEEEENEGKSAEKSEFTGDSQEQQIDESSITEKPASSIFGGEEEQDKENSIEDVDKPSEHMKKSLSKLDNEKEEEESPEDKPVADAEHDENPPRLSNIILGKVQNTFLTDSEKATDK